MPRRGLHDGRTGRPKTPDSVLIAIRQFDKMKEKSLFLAALTEEQRDQVKAIVDRLVNDTEGGWTATEYVQYGIIAWFIERWDKETKDTDPSDIDPRSLDAMLRYRKLLVDAMQTVRAARGKSDFFDRLKSVAIEASKDAGKLTIEFESKDRGGADGDDPRRKPKPIVLDVEPVEVDHAPD